MDGLMEQFNHWNGRESGDLYIHNNEKGKQLSNNETIQVAFLHL